jgi:hypothetical protein
LPIAYAKAALRLEKRANRFGARADGIDLNEFGPRRAVKNPPAAI